MTDDLGWFNALPQPVQAALLSDPCAALPPDLIARLPRLCRATYGIDDPATGGWTLRPGYAEHLRSDKRAAGSADSPHR